MAMGPGKKSTGWDFWSIESLFALATDLLHLSGLDDLLEMIGFFDNDCSDDIGFTQAYYEHAQDNLTGLFWEPLGASKLYRH